MARVRDAADAAGVPVSHDGRGSEWARVNGCDLRICGLRRRMYRREIGPQFFGGFRVVYVPLEGRGLKVAYEWVTGDPLASGVAS